MGKIADIRGLRLKLLILLLAFALIPVISIGLLTMMEIDRASNDAQERISGLSNTLNRSALTAASNEADQVQIAIAKAGQYDEFFRRIKSENEIVAKVASDSPNNQSCKAPLGIWIAPLGSNTTLREKMKRNISSLCVVSGVLHSVNEGEPASILGFVGTEDGLMITWPETQVRKAPYDHRDSLWYAIGRGSENAAWTKPYIDSSGSLAITNIISIRRGEEIFGVSGMNVSINSIYDDISSMEGRGYPFIIDESGTVIMRSSSRPRDELAPLFSAENFYESNSSEIRELVRNMLHGETGSSVIDLGKTEGYVAFAPISTVGWSYGLAYPTEEMSLPSRFIDAGIRDTAESVTKGLVDAVGIARKSIIITIILTFIIASAFAFFISARIERQAGYMADAADRIRNGDLDIPAIPNGERGIMVDAFLDVADGIKDYVARHETVAGARGASEKELEFLNEIKRSLQPGEISQPEGYEIVALFNPSVRDGFDFCDAINVGENKVALSMAEVSEGGLAGAMLAITSRALIRSSQSTDPARALSDVNIQINNYAQGVNLSCFYAVLDFSESTMEFVNAGFNPAFIIDSGGSVDTLGGGGIALGAIDRLELRPERIPIQSGDVLMVYSDGVTQAINAWRSQQGAERLITLVKENRSLSAQEILGVIEKEIRSYLKDHPLEHDSTLLILKRL